MSPIDHILLYIILFSVFFLFCKKNVFCKTEKTFWKLAIFPILCFALIEGCRYGRGPDYPAYRYRFEHIIPEQEPQKFFLLLMQVLDALGLNYVGLFIVYALIFCAGTFFFIRRTFNYKDAQWMYMLMLFSMLVKSESMIRQYIAMPFVFISLSAIFRKKWIEAVVCLIIAMNIHSGTMVMYPFVLLFYFFCKKLIPIKYTIPLLVLTYYVIPSGTFSDAGIKLLGVLNLSALGNENLVNYVEDSDRWLGADSFLDDAQQTFFTKTLQFIFDITTITVSYKALKLGYNNIVAVFFNVISVGFILERSFFGYEIFQRITGQLYIFWFIPLGYALHVYCRLPYCSKEKKTMNVLLLLAVAYQVFYYVRFVFFHPDAKFIWS